MLAWCWGCSDACDVHSVGCLRGTPCVFQEDCFGTVLGRGCFLLGSVHCAGSIEHLCLGCAQVSFEIADITSCDLAEESYDVVYSRDTILHIHNKPALFKRFGPYSAPSACLHLSAVCPADHCIESHSCPSAPLPGSCLSAVCAQPLHASHPSAVPCQSALHAAWRNACNMTQRMPLLRADS
jgi:hypothetical protein